MKRFGQLGVADFYAERRALEATEVFTLREGEWQVRLRGVVLPATYTSRGAAQAGLATEVRRAERRQEARIKQAAR